ncbi:MAG: putative quinol monooxygenase [Bacteroidota bacterium]
MLSVVAECYVKKGFAQELKAEMIKLLEPTRAEEGCINYDLHQDQEDENHFIFYENWESADHLAKHAKSAHIMAYREVSKDKIASMKIYKMDQVNS